MIAGRTNVEDALHWTSMSSERNELSEDFGEIEERRRGKSTTTS